MMTLLLVNLERKASGISKATCVFVSPGVHAGCHCATNVFFIQLMTLVACMLGVMRDIFEPTNIIRSCPPPPPPPNRCLLQSRIEERDLARHCPQQSPSNPTPHHEPNPCLQALKKHETPPGPDTTPQGPTSVDHKPTWLPLIPLKPNAWPAPNGDTIQSQSDETSPNRLSSGLIDLSGSDTGLHTTAEICEAATLTIDRPRLRLRLRSRPQQTLLSPDDLDRAAHTPPRSWTRRGKRQARRRRRSSRTGERG